MKSVFAQILALTLLSGSFLTACGPKESSEATGDVKVQIPWQGEDSDYKLQMVSLSGIDNLSRVSGKYAKFYLSPRVSANQLRGIEPNAQFVKTEKGFVPTTSLSLQMATVYAHLQGLAALDVELGVGSVNQWPRAVGLAVRMSDNSRNNAFYDGRTDALLIVPYEDSHLPISVNAGILAHEHFHSLFYKLVIEPLTKTSAVSMMQKVASLHADGFEEVLKDEAILPALAGAEKTDIEAAEVATSEHDLYHLVLTRGLNEGLADFWAWVYTGDPDFISLSLPRADKVRSLRYPGLPLPSKENILNGLSYISGMSAKDSHLTAYWYSLGTSFSRVIKGYTEVYGRAQGKTSLQARKEVARMILEALPDLKADLEQASLKKSFYTPADFLNSLVKKNPALSEEEQEYVDQKTSGRPDLGQFKLLPRKSAVPVE